VSIFDTLRDRVPVDQVTGGRVGEKVHCPAHADNTTPNLHIYEDHVYCFACAFYADVVAFWQVKHGFERPIDAALDLAREFGVDVSEQSPQARNEADERRSKEEMYTKQAQVCHRALDTHTNVREWWERRGFDEELQRQFVLGANRNGTEAVIPYFHRDRIKGLIHRKLEGEPKYSYPRRDEFPDGHKPLFIPSPLRDDVLLVEGIVDALALAALGESVAAVGGTNISAEQMRQLEKLSGPIYVLPDADPEGDKAARRWVRSLYPKALLCPAEYGEGRKDFADLFADEWQSATEVLTDLKAAAVDALYLELAEAPRGSDNLGAYRAVKKRILSLLPKLEDEGEQDAALHDVAHQLKLSIKPLRKALAKQKAMELSREPVEDEAATAEATVPTPGSARYERAMALLKDRRLLSKAAVDMKRLGHVGEFLAKKLGFVCAASARYGKPIQPSTHAQSAAGKNALWDIVLSLYPPEMIIRRSGLSAKALFRTQADLRGRVLYIQEVAGSEDANYTIRVMQSDGRLEYEATEKMPDGSLGNVVYQTEGPTVIVQTTTKNHLHPENETRVFPIFIDESEEQTKRIVESHLKEAAGRRPSEEEQEKIKQRWHDAIRLLEPAEVVMPYAQRIEMPRSPLRIRRDARRLLDVVRVIAWLHQHQRERDAEGRIFATEEDFNEALRLVSESLRRAWKTLTPSEEAVLGAIKELPEQHRSDGFKRRDLTVKGVSDRTVKEVLKSLTETGFLDCDGRQGPQGYTYSLAREAEEIPIRISLRPLPDD